MALHRNLLHLMAYTMTKASPVMLLIRRLRSPKKIGDPEWLLFEKCIPGDTSDNVSRITLGAPKKGTKNKVGMLEAFEDPNTKGFNWNNFMLQRWVDSEDVEHSCT